MYDAMENIEGLVAKLQRKPRNETETQAARRNACLKCYDAWKQSILRGADTTTAYLRYSIDAPQHGMHPALRHIADAVEKAVARFDRDDQRMAMLS